MFGYGIFENCFFVLKTIFRSKENKKTRRLCLIFLFFVMKNMKNTKNSKLREQERFSNNIKIVLFMFLKSVFKNCFKKQEPSISLSNFDLILIKILSKFFCKYSVFF